MRFSAIFVLILFSFSALAGEWKLTATKTYKPKNKAQIAAVLKKFPQILKDARMKIAEVTSLTVKHDKYSFEGDTLCAPNDPALKAEFLNYNICAQRGNNVSCASASNMGPGFEPCLFP